MMEKLKCEMTETKILGKFQVHLPLSGKRMKNYLKNNAFFWFLKLFVPFECKFLRFCRLLLPTA